MAVLLSCPISRAEDDATTRARQKLVQRQEQRKAEQQAPATRAEVDELRKQVKDLTAAVESLRQQFALVEKNLAIARANQAAPAAPAAAGKAGPAGDKLAIGMTMSQVKRLTKDSGELLSENEDGKIYQWVISNAMPVTEDVSAEQYGTYTLYVTFRNDKVVSFRRADNHDRS
jgi:hypothetical protein